MFIMYSMTVARFTTFDDSLPGSELDKLCIIKHKQMEIMIFIIMDQTYIYIHCKISYVHKGTVTMSVLGVGLNCSGA